MCFMFYLGLFLQTVTFLFENSGISVVSVFCWQVPIFLNIIKVAPNILDKIQKICC